MTTKFAQSELDPAKQKAGYHRHDDTLPLLVPVLVLYRPPQKIPRPNGLVAFFLVDIPSRWEPRAKQQPTGLIAYGTSCRRPVRALYRHQNKKTRLE